MGHCLAGLGGLRLLDRRSLAQDDVGIGSAEAKIVDADVFLRLWPWLLALENLQVPLFPGYLLIWFLEVMIRENKTSFKHHHGLDYGGYARRSLQVANVGLDGPYV